MDNEYTFGRRDCKYCPRRFDVHELDAHELNCPGRKISPLDLPDSVREANLKEAKARRDKKLGIGSSSNSDLTYEIEEDLEDDADVIDESVQAIVIDEGEAEIRRLKNRAKKLKKKERKLRNALAAAALTADPLAASDSNDVSANVNESAALTASGSNEDDLIDNALAVSESEDVYANVNEYDATGVHLSEEEEENWIADDSINVADGSRDGYGSISSGETSVDGTSVIAQSEEASFRALINAHGSRSPTNGSLALPLGFSTGGSSDGYGLISRGESSVAVIGRDLVSTVESEEASFRALMNADGSPALPLGFSTGGSSGDSFIEVLNADTPSPTNVVTISELNANGSCALAMGSSTDARLTDGLIAGGDDVKDDGSFVAGVHDHPSAPHLHDFIPDLPAGAADQTSSGAVASESSDEDVRAHDDVDDGESEQASFRCFACFCILM